EPRHADGRLGALRVAAVCHGLPQDHHDGRAQPGRSAATGTIRGRARARRGADWSRTQHRTTAGGQVMPARKRARFDPETSLRQAIRDLPGYQGVEDLEAVAAQYGVRPEDVIKLDGNENPYGASPRALAALRG